MDMLKIRSKIVILSFMTLYFVDVKVMPFGDVKVMTLW
jgi:hypothetical protein